MISIGLPVYNGEKFLQRRIENILSQKYQDFEIIISDNHSTDDTPNICRNFNDHRIEYFRQDKNMGGLWNFVFVLEKAKSDYFVWAGVDDIWSDDFLKNNVEFLQANPDFVGSIGQVESFGAIDRGSITKIIKIGKYGVQNATGSYENRVKVYLKRNSAQAIYAVFRTDAVRRSVVEKSFVAMDLAIILGILRFGSFNVLEDCHVVFYRGGFSSHGINHSTAKFGQKNKMLPYLPFTVWCWVNLGREIFLSNLFHFIKLNVVGFLAVVYGWRR